jgi:hypothetical protein
MPPVEKLVMDTYSCSCCCCDGCCVYTMAVVMLLAHLPNMLLVVVNVDFFELLVIKLLQPQPKTSQECSARVLNELVLSKWSPFVWTAGCQSNHKLMQPCR